MPNPGKPGNEAAIKKLLASRKWADRRAGLVCLNEAYCQVICGRLRRWSHANNLGLTAEDIADLWQITFKEVMRNVESGTFKSDGRLHGYLGKIARHRAIDLLRRRKLKIQDDVDPATVPLELPGSSSGLLEELELLYDALSDKLRFVLRVDVLLCYHSGGKWVSLSELTVEINRRYELSLPESTVKPRRERAREELRRWLRRRGYGG